MVYVFKAAIQGPIDLDVDAIAEEDTAAASSPSSGTGKSGGGLFGGENKLCIRILSPAARVTACMGVIGKNKQFCTTPGDTCTIQRHKTTKYKLAPNASSLSGTYVFIEVKPATLSSKWCLPVEAFHARADLFDQELRDFAGWEVTFRQLLANIDNSLGEESLVQLLDTSKRLGTPFSLMEPSAKKFKEGVIQAQVETSFLPVDTEELALTGAAKVGNLQEVINVVSKVLQDYRKNSVDNACRIKELDIPAVDLQLDSIKRIIGSRNEETDPRTLIATLEDLLQQVKELQEATLSTKDKENVEELFKQHSPSMEELMDTIHQGVLGSIRPLITWCNKMSDAEPCGKLMKRIKTLETMGTGNNLHTFGNLTLEPPLPAPNNAALEAALQRIDRLENMVKILKEEKSTKRVVLGETVFQYRLEVGAWLKAHTDGPKPPLYFMDSSSLLALAFGTKKEADGFMTSQATSIKSGYSTYQEGLVVHSFTIAIPVVFTSGKFLQDPTLLSGIPTWESFYGKSALEGFKYTFGLRLDDSVNTLMTNVTSNMRLSGHSMAHTCIQDAKRFCTSLVDWISNTYQDLDRQNPDSASDNWKYIARCVRAIFIHIHQARQVGVEQGVESSYLMWGCLQGRSAAAELMKKNFSGHSVVQAVLNEHMRSRAVMKEEYMKHNNDMKIEIANVINEVKILKGKVDKAQKKS